MDMAHFQGARAWLFDHALPFWAERGLDRVHGGFLEELGRDGAPTACPFKRVRVICRQIYVFSQAAALGWREGERPSRLGLEYLREHASLGGGRWARTISRAGEIMDATSDLYDLAFVIFALAWRFRVSGDSEALMLARETLAYIQKEHANAHGGYCEQRPQIGPRLQNPHMHLLESCLAAYEAFGASEFLAEAINIVDLMKRKLYDGASVGEEFDANWTRCSNPVEPGHQFEWVWILTQFQRLSGENLSGLAEALYVFAEAHGVSAHGLVYDQIDRAGGVTRATSRIWTNTERLKAALGRFELTGADTGAALHQSFDLIARKYFGARPAGLFVDRLDAEGTPIAGPTPASCLYHIVLAFTEMLRLEPAIVASHQASPRLPTTAARDVSSPRPEFDGPC